MAQFGWRIGLTLLLLALLLLISALQGVLPAGAQSGSDPLVLAFYYPWYDESTWSGGQTSDLPQQPYASSDRAAMGRQIDQARAAGIDAFVVAWYGPGGGNPTESNLTALLEEAAARNFRIAILLETTSPFLGGGGDVAAALQQALSVHAAQQAYLRVDGKPVIFVWRTNMFDLGTWQALRSQVDPGYGSIWIGDGTDTSYLTLFDGHYLYSNTWNPPADLDALDRKFADRVAASRAATGAPRYWVATTMPGYDDVRARGGFARDREGGGYYDRSWAAALGSAPNWVVITSFNEWMEGSQIEPSAIYGDQYLTQTAHWSAQFKSGGAVPALMNSAAVEENSAIVETREIANVESSSLALTPTLTVETPLLNIRSGPGSEFPILDTAGAGAEIPVIGLSSAAPSWWQVTYNGQTGWVSAELVSLAGPVEGLPDVDAALQLDVSVAAKSSVASELDAAQMKTEALTETVSITQAAAPIQRPQLTSAAQSQTPAGVPALLRPRGHGPRLSPRP